MRLLISLRCGECKRSVYHSRKNKVNTPDRITLKKYCKWCNKHVDHVETK
ncbi:50S ribosomal protein L33 [bacterium]|nr:50S ribosomal protein L33 [bacterium]